MSNYNQEELEFIEALVSRKYKELGDNLESIANSIANNSTFISIESALLEVRELENLLRVMKDLS